MQDLDELTLEVTWHSPELQTRVQNFYHKSSHVEEMKQSLTVSEAVGPPRIVYSMLSLVRIVFQYVVTCPNRFTVCCHLSESTDVLHIGSF